MDVQGNLVPPSPTAKDKQRSASREGKKFGRRWTSRSGSVSPSGSASSGSEARAAGSPAVVGGTSTAGIVTGMTTALGAGKRRKSDFEFKGGANDIVGIVMLEIQGADDFPRLANSELFILLFFSISVNFPFH